MSTFFSDDNATADTKYFGFTRVGTGEGFDKDSYKFSDLDRTTLDALLHAFATHTHSGSTALGDPTDPPDLTVATAGGTLPPGTAFFYRVSFIDARGLETAAGPEASVTTPDAMADPSESPALTVNAGGTLSAGDYSYMYSYTDPTGGETLPSPPSTVTVTQNASIEIDFPALPEGAAGIVLYRARPGQTDYFRRATDILTTSFVDNGSGGEDPTILAPVQNTTAATNLITVGAPLGFLPPGAAGWRIFRATESGGYDGDSLVHEVIETDGSGHIVLSFNDTGEFMSAGLPRELSTTLTDSLLSGGGGGGGGGGPITAADLPARSVMYCDVGYSDYNTKPRPTNRTDIKVLWTTTSASYMPANALSGDEVTVLT